MARKNGTPPVTEKMAAAIKWLLNKTDMAQHDIAAVFHINQGRISEVNTGKRFAHVPAIDPRDLGWTLN
ncbi:MAG: hypothetical protein AB7O49_04455 [Sphingomonadales bacterium]